ncbi:hypothetical protein J8J27_31450, partial [Mycobacterium tuberculosis]|nr:hypothetical protein [Mycobacterium tuberculosis]
TEVERSVVGSRQRTEEAELARGLNLAFRDYRAAARDYMLGDVVGADAVTLTAADRLAGELTRATEIVTDPARRAKLDEIGANFK